MRKSVNDAHVFNFGLQSVNNNTYMMFLNYSIIVFQINKRFNIVIKKEIRQTHLHSLLNTDHLEYLVD